LYGFATSAANNFQFPPNSVKNESNDLSFEKLFMPQWRKIRIFKKSLGFF